MHSHVRKMLMLRGGLTSTLWTSSTLAATRPIEYLPSGSHLLILHTRVCSWAFVLVVRAIVQSLTAKTFWLRTLRQTSLQTGENAITLPLKHWMGAIIPLARVIHTLRLNRHRHPNLHLPLSSYLPQYPPQPILHTWHQLLRQCPSRLLCQHQPV